jgi:hypothetical protein
MDFKSIHPSIHLETCFSKCKIYVLVVVFVSIIFHNFSVITYTTQIITTIFVSLQGTLVLLTIIIAKAITIQTIFNINKSHKICQKPQAMYQLLTAILKMF